MINMPAGPEIALILLLALLVLGPDQLPKAMRSFGNVMSEIRKVSSSFQDEMREALDIMETTAREEPADESTAGVAESSDRRDTTGSVSTADRSDSHAIPARTEADAAAAPAAGDGTSAPHDGHGSVDDGRSGRAEVAADPDATSRPVIDPADRAAG